MSKAALICRECGGKNYAGGLCHKHHRAAINRGETVQLARPSTGATKGMSVAERLAHYGQVNIETGCVEWTGSLFATGYGERGPLLAKPSSLTGRPSNASVGLYRPVRTSCIVATTVAASTPITTSLARSQTTAKTAT